MQRTKKNEKILEVDERTRYLVNGTKFTESGWNRYKVLEKVGRKADVIKVCEFKRILNAKLVALKFTYSKEKFPGKSSMVQ